ncbi:MFS transporter [Kocuria tytonicola]|uniref:MFS transporter n=1 Tax=Kocuria tytonicola TaxID=2055946 RepID=A0A3L9L6M0_9MICC|nr:MFS transporter [Kocuria tytonicola]RLY93794.1 MFS transporter [Kocuria tytonicola]
MTSSRSALSLPAVGGWPFLVTALIGRLPAATVQLGLLLYVSGAGLGLGLAGMTVAAAGLGSAIGAPAVGGLVDRFGPLPVVLGATVVQLIGMGSLLAVVLHDAPHALILVCAAVIGSANPQVGAIARARWSALARRRRLPGLVSRALGYETACDEVGFILGPVIAGVLLGLFGPNPALLLLMGWVVLGQGCFIVYLLRRRGLTVDTHTMDVTDGIAPRIRWTLVLPPMLACLCVGTVFGSTQTALTAINTARGTEGYTGVIYGCMGVGSALASVLVSRLPQRLPLSLRVAVGALLVSTTSLLLLSIPGPLVLGVLFALAGLGVGSMLVSAYTRGEHAAPSHRIASVMTTLTTCLVLGVSFGSALGGVLSEVPQRGFLLTLGAGLTGLVAAVAMHVTRPREVARRVV